MTATTLRRLIVMGLIVLWEALPSSGLIPVNSTSRIASGNTHLAELPARISW